LPASTEQVLAILLESGPGTTDGEIPQMLLVADSGLSGSWYSLGAGDTLWDFVIFADDRYAYSMAMKTDPKNRGAHVETFAEVARSVQPIPRRCPRASSRGRARCCTGPSDPPPRSSFTIRQSFREP
jgi:hypothetical protein